MCHLRGPKGMTGQSGAGLLRKAGTRILIAVVVVATVGLALWYTVRFPEASAVAECKLRYAAARSPADSAQVATFAPGHSRNQIAQRMDCGTRQRLGQL